MAVDGSELTGYCSIICSPHSWLGRIKLSNKWRSVCAAPLTNHCVCHCVCHCVRVCVCVCVCVCVVSPYLYPQVIMRHKLHPQLQYFGLHLHLTITLCIILLISYICVHISQYLSFDLKEEHFWQQQLPPHDVMGVCTSLTGTWASTNNWDIEPNWPANTL